MTRRSLLIIRLSALGDVAMTIPVIYSLAWQYPTLAIRVLTRPFFARLFINRPANIDIMEADFEGRHQGLTGLCRLMRQIGRYKFSRVADLHNVSRSWVIDAWMMLRGCRVAMVDKKRAGRKNVLRGHGVHPNFVRRYADVFARLGYEVELTFRSLYADTVPPCPLPVAASSVGIAPFARYENKVYPWELMEEVVALLCRKGYAVYLFGARGEEARRLEALERKYERCMSLAGRYSLEEELCIMQALSVMLTMDSANQHLASLVGVRVVTVWGSTTPACGFSAYGQSEAAAVCAHLPCQPCSIAGGSCCPEGHFRCMKSLRPEVLVAKIEQLMSE